MNKTVRHHYIPIRMTKIETLTTPNAGKNVEHQELLLMVECKMLQSL